MGQDYQWAEALRKAKSNERKEVPTLFNFATEPKISLEQLEEQMVYYKQKLKDAAEKKNIPEIRSLVERLIHNHARQTALLIRQEKMLGAKENAPEIRHLLKKYFSDCTKLTGLFSS